MLKSRNVADDRQPLLAGRRWERRVARRRAEIAREREPLRHDDAATVREPLRALPMASAPRMSRPQPSGPGRIARSAISPADVGTSTERVRLTPRTPSMCSSAARSLVREASAVAVEVHVHVGRQRRAEPIGRDSCGSSRSSVPTPFTVAIAIASAAVATPVRLNDALDAAHRENRLGRRDDAAAQRPRARA